MENIKNRRGSHRLCILYLRQNDEQDDMFTSKSCDIYYLLLEVYLRHTDTYCLASDPLKYRNQTKTLRKLATVQMIFYFLLVGGFKIKQERLYKAK